MVIALGVARIGAEIKSVPPAKPGPKQQLGSTGGTELQGRGALGFPKVTSHRYQKLAALGENKIKEIVGDELASS
jgi:hypothetical protein